NIAYQTWLNSRPVTFDDKLKDFVHNPLARTKPRFPSFIPVRGLPDEFSDYFDGVIAWNKPNLAGQDDARTSWQQLLDLPAVSRHFTSTWAAYMLGRSWATNNPVKAEGYFRRVRDLVDHGFADPLGLAEASLGEEARIELQSRQFGKAMDLYLQQYES